METNAVLRKDGELYKKGQLLLEAAREYWKEYNVHFDRGAVVYLEADNGALIVFTRSEYKRSLMAAVDEIHGGEPLSEKLFTAE